jgi:hypothetical protein
MKRYVGLAAAVIVTVAFWGACISASQPKPAPAPLRVGLNTCNHAWLYTWPDQSSQPVAAHFLPSHLGEQFEIIRGPVYTLEGDGYYETTVTVVPTTGSGAHYWISSKCINPSTPTKAP